jgi:hypothetical protein
LCVSFDKNPRQASLNKAPNKGEQGKTKREDQSSSQNQKIPKWVTKGKETNYISELSSLQVAY